MKITILSKNFLRESNQGVFKYVWNLVKKLKEDKSIDIKVLYDNNKKNFKQWLFFDFFTLPKKLIFQKADVYHAVMPEEAISCFFLRKRPFVTTIHDVIPIVFPKEANFIVRLYFKIACFFAKRSDAIITDSRSTKKDLVEYLKIPKKKVFVIFIGVNHNLFKIRKRETKENRVGYLGGFSRRKNLQTLIRAFKIVANEINSAKLIIGGNGKQIVELKELVKKLGLEKNIEFRGFIPEKELPKFYQSLKVFVFPSLYEGFGIPPLEAMACGVPVVVSNRSSLPEVVGDAGLVVEPNEEELARAMITLLRNKKLREELSRKAVKRSKVFTWSNTAEKTLEVYKKVLLK